MTDPGNRFDDNFMRAFAMMAAGILLNLGLFFVLAIFAPIVVGIVCGYILGHEKHGILAGILSSAFAYSLIFVATGFATDLAEFGSAVLIMCAFAGFGGWIGVFIQKKMRESSQVSTTILPGE
ncbi:MAG: hypothetical protein RTV72_07550 [Candidatus Thorarchaeota archaeon]